MTGVGVALMLASCVACTAPPPDLPQASSEFFDLAPRPDCTHALWAAVRASDAKAVSQLVSQGAAVSCGGSDDSTLLALAIYRDEPQMVALLLNLGAGPNMRWGGTGGDYHAMRVAIEMPLMKMPQVHRAEIVALLLHRGADPNLRWCPFESRGDGGGRMRCTAATAWTPLMMAASLDQADTVAQLIAAGADPNIQEVSGMTALDLASSDAVFGLLLTGSSTDPAKAEAEAVASFGRRYPPPYVRNVRGQTLLDHAAGLRAYGMVRLALASGADPNLPPDPSAPAPVLAATAWTDWRAGAELLLTHGANANARWCPTHIEGRDGQTPIPVTNCRPESGVTPLMFAAEMGADELVLLLMSHGADVNARDWEGRTALDYARRRGDDRITSMLT